MNITARLRAARARARTNRDLARALDRAATPAMRQELLAIAARGQSNPR